MTELRDEVARAMEATFRNGRNGCDGSVFQSAADAAIAIVIERAAIQVRDAMLENYARHFEGGGEPHDGDAQIDCLMTAIRNLAPETTP